MLKTTAALILALVAVTAAEALEQRQRDAASMDALLGVAESRCGHKMPRHVFKALQTEIHPRGFDRVANQFKISEQDRYFSMHRRDPDRYCSETIQMFGPNGTLKPGWLESR